MTVTHERQWTNEGRPALNRMGVPMVDGPWVDEPDSYRTLSYVQDECASLARQLCQVSPESVSA